MEVLQGRKSVELFGLEKGFLATAVCAAGMMIGGFLLRLWSGVEVKTGPNESADSHAVYTLTFSLFFSVAFQSLFYNVFSTGFTTSFFILRYF
jgi:hypothetical protein